MIAAVRKAIQSEAEIPLCLTSPIPKEGSAGEEERASSHALLRHTDKTYRRGRRSEGAEQINRTLR